MAGNLSSWVFCPKPITSARLRLICFPYAGAGVSAFSGWHQALPPEVEVGYAQLPGRDGQRRDVPLTDFSSLIAKLADALKDDVDVPMVFFGHSMGALIGFELARELRRRRLSTPVHLLVSALRAPQLKQLDVGERPLHTLSDAALIRELHRRYGTPPDFVQDSELLELVLPLLRADLALCESYEYRVEAPLNCSIAAFGGADDLRVTRSHLEAWREQTAGAFNLRIFPGDHFFARTNAMFVLPALRQQLVHVLRRTGDPAP